MGLIIGGKKKSKKNKKKNVEKQKDVDLSPEFVAFARELNTKMEGAHTWLENAREITASQPKRLGAELKRLASRPDTSTYWAITLKELQAATSNTWMIDLATEIRGLQAQIESFQWILQTAISLDDTKNKTEAKKEKPKKPSDD